MADSKRPGNRKTKASSVGEKIDENLLSETQREFSKDFKEDDVYSGVVSI